MQPKPFRSAPQAAKNSSCIPQSQRASRDRFVINDIVAGRACAAWRANHGRSGPPRRRSLSKQFAGSAAQSVAPVGGGSAALELGEVIESPDARPWIGLRREPRPIRAKIAPTITLRSASSRRIPTQQYSQSVSQPAYDPGGFGQRS